MASDGEVSFDTAIDTTGAEKDAKSLETTMTDSMNKTASVMTSAGKKMTLAITGPAVAMAGFGTKMAIELDSVNAKFDVVFGEMSDDMLEFMDVVLEIVPVTELEFKKMTSAVADLLKPMGFTTEQATLMTIEFFKLSAAIAAFNGLDPAEVMLDFQRALVTGPTILAKYGIGLSKAETQQIGLAEAQKLGIEVTDKQAEALGLLTGSFEQSTDAIAGFEANSAGLDVQIALLTRDIKTLMTNLGELFIPIIADVVDWMLKAIDAFMELDDETKSLILKIGGLVVIMGPLLLIGGKLLALFSPMLLLVGFLIIAFGKLAGEFRKTSKAEQELADQTRVLGKVFSDLTEEEIADMIEHLELTEEELDALMGLTELTADEFEELAEKLGVTTEELEEMIDAGQDAEEILLGLARSGDINKISFQEMVPVFEKNAKLMNISKEEAEEFAKTLDGLTHTELAELKKEMGLTTEEFEEFKEELGNLDEIEELRVSLGLTEEEFDELSVGIAEGGLAFEDITEDVSLFRKGLNLAKESMNLLVDAVQTGLGKMGDVLGEFVEFGKEQWTIYGEDVTEIWDGLVETFEDLWVLSEDIAETAVDAITGFWDTHQEDVQKIWDKMVNAFILFGELIEEIFEDVVEALIRFWDKWGDELVRILQFAGKIVIIIFGFFVNAWKTAVEMMTVIWSLFGDDLIRIAEKIFGAIIRVTDSIWVSGFNALMALVTGDWDTMWSELANIAGFFGDIIIGVIERMINRLIDFINIGINAINIIPGVNIPNVPPAHALRDSGGASNATRFADGGVVTGPTLGVIGEAGDNEAVVPLTPRGISQFLGGVELSTGFSGMMANITVESKININLNVDGRTLTEIVVENIDDVVQMLQPIKQ